MIRDRSRHNQTRQEGRPRGRRHPTAGATVPSGPTARDGDVRGSGSRSVDRRRRDGRRCGGSGRRENAIGWGPSGTGKTHFVEALAHNVIDAGMRVSWFTLESLTEALARANVDGSAGKVIARITRAELIVVDDIGMLPAGQAAAEAFYRLVDATYERRSLAVTSNLHPAGFDTFMPKTLATAAVDRLLHHAHVIITEGTSLRLAEATTGRGVIPLT